MKYLLLILRYIKGYVVFRCDKGFTERFLNLSAQKGIYIWDITRHGKTLTASMSFANYKKIRSIARRSGVQLKIIKKVGLILLLKRYRKRVGLLIGLTLFIAFHIFMNQFVWCFDVSGNESISKYDILQKAQANGLTYGTYTKNLDAVRLSRVLANEYDGKVSWLSVNIKGSIAVIELREDSRLQTETENETPCNIIADFDGIILSLDTLKGEKAVEVGSGVKKGDLLISGVVDNENLSASYFHAKGIITALREKDVSLSYPLTSSCYYLEERDSYRHISFFGIEVPLGLHRKEDKEYIFCDRVYLEISGYKLPFFIDNYSVVALSEKTETEEESRLLSSEYFVHTLYDENKNSRIVSSEEKISLNNGSFVFYGKYNLIDYLGQEKEILRIE